MPKLVFVIITCFLTAGLPLTARLQEKKPEAKSFPMFTASYSLQMPGGDMKTRFGINSTIGGSFIYKHKTGLLFDLSSHYLFGTALKEEASSILDGIKDSDGHIINEHGEFAKVVLSERGFFAGARLGYVIPVLKDNPNSGIIISGGGGLLQHKIRIENDGNNAPQILHDYKKGYDKLTNGFCLTEFVGFVYFGKQHLVNFYAGFEFYQGFTQSRRSYDFNLMGPDLQKRRDYLSGFKVGWIIPVYQRAPDPFYTN